MPQPGRHKLLASKLARCICYRISGFKDQNQSGATVLSCFDSASLNLCATRQLWQCPDVQLGHSVALSCYLFVLLNSLHCCTSLWLAWVALETRPQQMSTKGKVLLSALLVASRSGSIHAFEVCQIGFWILSRSKGPVWPDPHSLKALWRTPGVWESLIHRWRLSVGVLNSRSRTLQ